MVGIPFGGWRRERKDTGAAAQAFQSSKETLSTSSSWPQTARPPCIAAAAPHFSIQAGAMTFSIDIPWVSQEGIDCQLSSLADRV